MHHDAGAGSADLIGGYAPTEKMATALACRNRLGARSIAISMVRHQSPSAGDILGTQRAHYPDVAYLRQRITRRLRLRYGEHNERRCRDCRDRQGVNRHAKRALTHF